MSVKIIKEAAVLAQQYNQLNRKIAELEKEKDAIKPKLLAVFPKIGMDSFRVAETGELVTKVIRRGVAITNEVFARKWAEQNNCMKINEYAVAKKLESATDIPEGFEPVETESIRITIPKQK